MCWPGGPGAERPVLLRTVGCAGAGPRVVGGPAAGRVPGSECIPRPPGQPREPSSCGTCACATGRAAGAAQPELCCARRGDGGHRGTHWQRQEQPRWCLLFGIERPAAASASQRETGCPWPLRARLGRCRTVYCSNSLRFNVDPFAEFSDAHIWAVLRTWGWGP